jgi:methylmalonyl-CoA mutase C-terminal domain/subunit
VVEVEVGDRDRVDVRAAVALAEAAEDARAAVEQEPAGVRRALQEVARVRAPRVRPGRGGADDGQAHPHILADVARKIRVVIAKPGLDGHDRGAKIIARALRDAGMEVIYTGLHQTPEQIVETAIQEDADAVGISILSGAHMTLVPRILEGLRENELEDILVLVGGTIPRDDVRELKEQGVAEVFTPGAPVSAIVDFLRENVPVEA